MEDTIPIQLIEERATMLITLYAKALDSLSKRSILKDEAEI